MKSKEQWHLLKREAGPIRRRVRLRTNVMASHGHLFCTVRKRTLRYAVESTISNLAEL